MLCLRHLQKATARRRVPITKVFQTERMQEIYAVVDVSRLEADALHFSSDMWSSIVVLGGLGAVWAGIPAADSIAALVVSAFIAILENAIQCSSPGQTIVVQTQADHLRGQLSIEDNGPGIAEDMLSRLFEPFATNRVTGTGLGLAIAQNAIRSHRGEITAQNKPEGGALFVVALPSMANF